MSATHDFREVFAALARLPQAVHAVCQDGVDAIQPAVQQAMQESAAHGDYSGASHASYRALTATNAATEAASGYAAAQSALANQSPSYGHAVSEPTGIVQGEHEVVMVLTDYTSYGADRETGGAGEKAVEGPTLQQFGQPITASIAAASRGRFR
jgi:hypothetical protein